MSGTLSFQKVAFVSFFAGFALANLGGCSLEKAGTSLVVSVDLKELSQKQSTPKGGAVISQATKPLEDYRCLAVRVKGPWLSASPSPAQNCAAAAPMRWSQAIANPLFTGTSSTATQLTFNLSVNGGPTREFELLGFNPANNDQCSPLEASAAFIREVHVLATSGVVPIFGATTITLNAVPSVDPVSVCAPYLTPEGTPTDPPTQITAGTAVTFPPVDLFCSNPTEEVALTFVQSGVVTQLEVAPCSLSGTVTLGGTLAASVANASVTGQSWRVSHAGFSKSFPVSVMSGGGTSGGAPTQAPSGLAVWALNASIFATWGSVPGATEYEAQKANDAAMSTGADSFITPSTTAQGDGGFANGVAYFFRVRAKNASGTGPWSAVVGPRTPIQPSFSFGSVHACFGPSGALLAGTSLPAATSSSTPALTYSVAPPAVLPPGIALTSAGALAGSLQANFPAQPLTPYPIAGRLFDPANFIDAIGIQDVRIGKLGLPLQSTSGTSYNFGLTSSTTSVTLHFTNPNCGPVTPQVSLATGSTAYSITANGCASAIGSGGTCSVTVAFLPAGLSPAQYSGTLSISSSDGSVDASSITLIGTAGTTGSALTWNGSQDSSWTIPGNWSTNTVPDSNSIVVIPGGLARYPNFSNYSGGAARLAYEIKFLNGGTITFNGTGTSAILAERLIVEASDPTQGAYAEIAFQGQGNLSMPAYSTLEIGRKSTLSFRRNGTLPPGPCTAAETFTFQMGTGSILRYLTTQSSEHSQIRLSDACTTLALNSTDSQTPHYTSGQIPHPHLVGIQGEGRLTVMGSSTLVGSLPKHAELAGTITALGPLGNHGSGIHFGQISAGDGFACGLKAFSAGASGPVFCWGKNDIGQVTGFPANPSQVFTPRQLISDYHYQSVSVGGRHACAIRGDGTGTVDCWGSSYTGVSMIAGVTGVIEIDAGESHTCARTSSDQVYCWGDNTHGQINGTTTPASTPTPSLMTISGVTGFTQISAGGQASCGITNEVPSRMICWGKIFSTTPGITTYSGFKNVSVGSNHVCAITTSGSHVTCWGDNSSQQAAGMTAPAGKTFSQLTSGYFDTCAVLGDPKELWCWGKASEYRTYTVGGTTFTPSVRLLGIPGSTALSAPARVDLHPAWWNMSPPAEPTHVTRGNGFGCAVVQNMGTLCWGDGGDGQLGLGDQIRFTNAPVELGREAYLMLLGGSQLQLGPHWLELKGNFQANSGSLIQGQAVANQDNIRLSGGIGSLAVLNGNINLSSMSVGTDGFVLGLDFWSQQGSTQLSLMMPHFAIKPGSGFTGMRFYHGAPSAPVPFQSLFVVGTSGVMPPNPPTLHWFGPTGAIAAQSYGHSSGYGTNGSTFTPAWDTTVAPAQFPTSSYTSP